MPRHTRPFVSSVLVATAFLLAGCSSEEPAAEAPPTTPAPSLPAADADETAPPTTTTTTEPPYAPLVFDPPPGYGGTVIYDDQGPVDEDSIIPTVREPGADMVLFSAADAGERLTTAADLMVMTLPSRALVTMNEGAYESVAVPGQGDGYLTDHYAGFGFTTEVAWLDDETAVVAVSRSAPLDEVIGWLASIRREDGVVSLDGEPAGLREVSRGRFFHQFGPIADSRGQVGLHHSSWTTGGQGAPGQTAQGSIRIFARELDPIDLLFVEELARSAEFVTVRGGLGMLGRYPQWEAPALAWVEDGTTLMIMATTDPEVDLVAMADSGRAASPTWREEQFESSRWGDDRSTQVAAGIDIGREWRLWAAPDAEYDIKLCMQTRLNGEEWTDSFGCRIGDGLAGFGDSFGGIQIGDQRFAFLAGLVPGCATDVAATPETGAAERVTAPTFEADDGRRYFTIVTPLAPFTADSSSSGPFVQALDESGTVIDDTSSGTWTVHC